MDLLELVTLGVGDKVVLPLCYDTTFSHNMADKTDKFISRRSCLLFLVKW